ncbi:MAG: hypothetical protein H0W61_07500 [Bacteroidetes bacterium]|nr:hypothetical protein [Bacteroidota bacterium]
MKNKITLLLIAGALILCGSCKRNGLGGEATLVVFMKHHGNIIKNHKSYPDTIFIKFKAKDLPGTTPDKFDTYFVGEEGEDHIHCRGLRAGKYYLYGVGIDSTGPYRVKGGLAVKINWSERKQEIDTDLPVSE